MKHIKVYALRNKSRVPIMDRLLWGVIGTLAVGALVVNLLEMRVGVPVNRFGLFVGSLLLCLCIAGFILRWGPIVPCMFVGMVVFSLMASPISSSHEEAVSKILGVPIFGGICGAVLGFVVESSHSRTPEDSPDQSEPTSTR